MTLLHDVPYREISLVRNNDRTYRFSFEDLNTPVAPIFSNNPDGGTTGLSQRTLYDFPDGTTFTLKTDDDVVHITRSGTWDDEHKQIVFDFTPEDTADVDRDRNAYYEIDAVFPNGKRYTILAGYLFIFTTRRLNG